MLKTVYNQSYQFNPNTCSNETEVESKFIVSYLLPKLGYSPDEWGQQVVFSKIRLDFLVIIANKLKTRIHFQFIIEAKSPSENLDHHVNQLERYLFNLNIRYGVLTNGHSLRVYEKTENYLKVILEIKTHEINIKINEIKAILGKEKLLSVNSSKIKLDQNYKTKSNMKVISVYHNKGGVGKTTTVVNLAAAMSRKGKRVLVIDLDSQANTTFATGLVKFQDELDDDIKKGYIYHIVVDRNKNFIPEIVRKSSFTTPTFDVIPSHIDLMCHEKELGEVASILFRLPNKLEMVSDQYDVVLIDTPPSLNLYAKIALVASDYLIIPSDLKPFSNEGLINVSNFIDDINEVRSQMSKESVKVLGVLPSKVTTSARFIEFTLPNMEAKVKNRYGFSLLNTRIFERRDLSAALERTVIVGNYEIPDPQSIFDFDPNSKSTKEFRDLANEVMSLINL
jgi:cellulose biosynthesis protein BcsQ